MPEEIVMVFLLALGASVGSFLNVVAYRVPEEMSLVRPGSHCVKCKHPIAWYDNIPVLSWFLLRGKCRHCGAKFSIQYALVELFTGLLFAGFYWAYFMGGLRAGMPGLSAGGWLVYAGHMVLVSALLASSLVDGQRWIIPLEIPRTAGLVGVLLSMIWPYVVAVEPGELWRVVPYATAKSGGATLGAVLGLGVSYLLVKKGVLGRSFMEYEQALQAAEKAGEDPESITVNIRREMVREVGFLACPVVLGLLAMWILTGEHGLARGWNELVGQQKWFAGLLGSGFGFMIGGLVVWTTRILGSVAFGREAMGLGDVHLMAAVGAVLGWVSPTIAFFVAPFFGLGWAVMRLVLHRSREIPYGPFLSVGTVVVMVMHDRIVDYFLAATQGPMVGP